MNRALPTVAMTAAGLALLANFQTSDPAVKLGSAMPATQLASASSPAPTSGSPGGSAASASSASTPPPTSTGPTTTVPRRTPTSGAAPATASTAPPQTAPVTTAPPLTSPPTTAVSGTFTGPEVRTRYGPVQVQVTIENGNMVDVQTLELPSRARTSRWINDQAGPILNSEALRIQSADIQHLGGATYTWRAYTESLQAALDQAGYQAPTAVAG